MEVGTRFRGQRLATFGHLAVQNGPQRSPAGSAKQIAHHGPAGGLVERTQQNNLDGRRRIAFYPFQDFDDSLAHRLVRSIAIAHNSHHQRRRGRNVGRLVEKRGRRGVRHAENLEPFDGLRG